MMTTPLVLVLGLALTQSPVPGSAKVPAQDEALMDVEAPTPDVSPSIGEQMWNTGATGVRQHGPDIAAAPWRETRHGARRAWLGDAQDLGLQPAMVGATTQWRAAGVDVGAHVVETPVRLRSTWEDAAWAGQEVFAAPGRAAWSTTQAWREAAVQAREATAALQYAEAQLAAVGAQGRALAWEEMRQDLRAGLEAGDSRDAWLVGWAALSEAAAWDMFTAGTARQWALTRERTTTVRDAWWSRTKNAAGTPARWSVASWKATVDGGLGAWRNTPGETARVWRAGQARAARVSQGVWTFGAAPLRAVPGMTAHVRDYMWLHGWTRGVQAATHAAADAWAAGDVVNAFTWSTGGVGKGLFHLGLGALLVPGIAVAGVGITGVMLGLGYPWALLQHGVAAGNAVATAGAGSVAGLAVWTLGGAATVASVGAGAVHAASTALVGTALTSATAFGHAVLTLGTAGAGGFSLVTTPVLAGGALVLGQAWDGARWSARLTGGLAGQGARLAWQGATQGARVLPWAWSTTTAAGGAAAWSTGAWLRAPLDGALATGATAVRTVARWGEHPASAVAHALGGVGLAARGSTGAAVSLMSGVAQGAADGAQATARTAWGLGQVVGGGAVASAEFTGRAVNVPQHRAWAQARQPEAHAVLQHLQPHVPDAGELILIRVSWWGQDTGKVRFFVTRDPATGKRWYFERVVDPRTCTVSYRATSQDPIRRAWTTNGWTRPLPTSMTRAGCSDAGGAHKAPQLASR
jgi:hypothetical protein